VSSGGVLALVAVVLAVVLAGLFRLVGVLDSAELALRRLAAELRAARKAVAAAGELAAAVERDAAQGQAAFDRLAELKHPPSGPGDRGAGPVSLPQRPGPTSPG
jgi:hypothetical protein